VAGLDRYSVEVSALADEMLAYLSGENYHNANRMLDIIGIEGLVMMSPEDREGAIKFIEMTPSARQRKIEKMDGKEAFRLLVCARYAALVGARMIKAANRLELIPGSSYRRAAGLCAQEALRYRWPTRGEILPASAEYDHFD